MNKIGAKVVSHARYVVSQMAEVAISRNLFADILATGHLLGHIVAGTDAYLGNVH